MVIKYFFKKEFEVLLSVGVSVSPEPQDSNFILVRIFLETSPNSTTPTVQNAIQIIMGSG